MCDYEETAANSRVRGVLMMDWIYDEKNNDWDAYPDETNIYTASVLVSRGYWGAIWQPTSGDGGFLSRAMHVGSGYWETEKCGLPIDCQFSTKEEAQAVCERHYNLTVLQ